MELFTRAVQEVLALEQMAQVAVAQVLQVTVLTHQVQLVVMVD
jgi:hypothetical protein